MFDRFREYGLPRVLFWGTLALGVILGGAVLLSPWLTTFFAEDPLLLSLFARDAVVRRTSLVGAAGLAVTALVFFRGKPWPRLRDKRSRTPPRDIAGA